MTAPAAIQATYSDLKFIKSRKVAQITLEVPIEAASDVVAMFGTPNPAAEIWVALARLKSASSKSTVDAQPGEAPRERRRFNELSPAQQAALKCKHEAFQRFMSVTGHSADMTEEAVAAGVRFFCGVKSRSQLNDNRSAALLWRALSDEFDAWMQVDA